jgi:vanillate/3-O-methylgallate O-demethylase
MEMPSPFTQQLATPVYDDVALYQVANGMVKVWEFDGWKPESLSWKHGATSTPGSRGPCR